MKNILLLVLLAGFFGISSAKASALTEAPTEAKPSKVAYVVRGIGNLVVNAAKLRLSVTGHFAKEVTVPQNPSVQLSFPLLTPQKVIDAEIAKVSPQKETVD